MSNQADVNRRRFLEQVTAWSAGLALAPPVFKIATAAAAEEVAATQSVISTATGKDYARLVETVLKPLGGIKAFVSKGDKVVIKPNMGWDRAPEYAANTHPEVMKTLVKMALDAGAKKVSVFDRTCNAERLCYKNSGIRDAVNSLDDKRIECSFMDERKWMPVKIEKGKAVKEWELYRDAIEADCYINVPIAKNHSIAKLTMGLKNVMGVMGGRRGKIHRELGQSLADLNTVIRPKLTVIDATRILLNHGPQGGDLDDVKVLDTLIASTDPIAADAFTTTLFGFKPEEIASTVAGYESGLGEMDLEKVKIIKA